MVRGDTNQGGGSKFIYSNCKLQIAVERYAVQTRTNEEVHIISIPNKSGLQVVLW